jgi:DNA-binding NarL/FixJ family response regulator
MVIIDRRQLSRYCLANVVQSCFADSTVASFSTVDEFLESGSDLRPVNAILLCVAGGCVQDPAIARDIEHLTGMVQAPPVILVSDNEDPDQILRAFENGIRGYLPTTSTFEVAVEAVRLVKAGGAYVPATSLVSSLQRESNIAENAGREDRADGFTTRQTAVLKALREGKANKIIAYELNMRESTVKVHVRNIMRKLNARNRTEVTFKTMNLFVPERAGTGRRGDIGA